MTALAKPESLGACIVAEFASARELVAAVDALSRERFDDVETYAPFDIPELDAPLGLARSRLGWLVMAGGLIGLVLSYGIQWWANVHEYPLDIGGRPVHAMPAFLLATFEGTVLGAALAAVAGLLVLLRLPRLWAPIDEVHGFDRASIDRFWIVLRTFASDRERSRAERLLHDAGALRTIRTGDA